VKARERERERERDGVEEQAARFIPLLSQHPFCEILFWRGERYLTGKLEEEKGRKKPIEEGG